MRLWENCSDVLVTVMGSRCGWGMVVYYWWAWLLV